MKRPLLNSHHEGKIAVPKQASLSDCRAAPVSGKVPQQICAENVQLPHFKTFIKEKINSRLRLSQSRLLFFTSQALGLFIKIQFIQHKIHRFKVTCQQF